MKSRVAKKIAKKLAAEKKLDWKPPTVMEATRIANKRDKKKT